MHDDVQTWLAEILLEAHGCARDCEVAALAARDASGPALMQLTR